MSTPSCASPAPAPTPDSALAGGASPAPSASLLATGPLHQALHASDNAILITNEDLRLVYVNDGFTRLLGYRPDEVLGRRPNEVLLGPHSDPDLLVHVRSALDDRGMFQGQTLMHSRSGQARWVWMVVNRSDTRSGGPGGSITMMTDITDTKMLEELQKRVLQSIVSELPLSDLMTQVCREVEHIAPEVTATILSVDRAGRLRTLAAPRLPPPVSAALDGLPIGPKAGSCGTAAFHGRPVVVTDIFTDPLWADYHHLFADTGLRACWSSPIFDHQGQVVGTFAFYFRESQAPDATHQRLVDVCLHLCALAIERDTSRQRIQQLAYFDVLTGLPNRVMFRTNAERTLQALRREQDTGALVFVDLDRFKQVNDTQGHAAGDALLCAVAERLTQCIRPVDLIGRLSGDEFVLMLSGCSTDQAIQLARRMLQALAEPLMIHGQLNVPSASIGIAMYPDDGNTIDTLLRHADQAMYQSKSEQLHGLQLFSAELNRQAQERVALERALREALQARTLTLHYQPQVISTDTARLHGVEALARWQHATLGSIGPDRFIPLAEETGLIHELTRWLLDEACGQLRAWRAAGHTVPTVAINLSGRSFVQAGFAEQVAQTLQQHGLAPQDLLLEITESVMMDQRPTTLANIESLHRRGFRLSLDDFGTGYSSLSYLHRLPIAELKLDRAFVQDLESSDAARALTLSVLSIAQSLGVGVVAEGVETAEQADWLRAQGCPVMQGYAFARPMSAQALVQWMQSPVGAAAG